MLNQHLNNDYLDSMGIVSWQRRQKAEQALSHFSIDTLQGTLTLVANFTGPTRSLQQQLWANILDALQYVKIDDTDLLADQLLVFGKTLAEKFSVKQLSVTDSLAEIVAQPQRKAKVWETLRCYCA